MTQWHASECQGTRLVRLVEDAEDEKSEHVDRSRPKPGELSQLSLVNLQELVEQAFAGYAAREYAATRDGVDDRPGDPVTASLRQSPKDVQEAVKAKGLSWSALVTRQEEDIKRIQPSLGRFERPVRALLQPARSTAAHQWLIGAPPDPDMLKDLGVDSAIEDTDAARLGLHVLAMLARAAQRPFILVLDQVESLVDPDDTLDAANSACCADSWRPCPTSPASSSWR